jgi:hypothetical protein
MPKTRIERVWTRDARIPLVAGDDDWTFGFQCIPLPPSLDGGWTIFDMTKNYKTGWQRVVRLDS